MSHKIKIYIITMGLFLIGATQLYIHTPNALAAFCTTPGEINCTIPPVGANTTPTNDVDCPSGQANADHTGCVPLGNDCTGKESGDACLKKNPIFHYVNIIIGFLSGLVGVVVVAIIIIGGIQYSMAGDNSTAVQEARKKITNGFIALFAFMFLFAFLEWLVPGGII